MNAPPSETKRTCRRRACAYECVTGAVGEVSCAAGAAVVAESSLDNECAKTFAAGELEMLF